MKAWISLFVSLIIVAEGLAGPSGKAITAVRTDRPPTLDGMVNEPQWQITPPILDFVQFNPNEGALPTEQTSVRILYDDHALYVGVICYDSKPEQIVEQLTRRDRSSKAERFTVQIDSYHDHQTAFVFTTNVSGVQSDGVLSQDGAIYDISWDAVWSVKAVRYLDGWSAEFEIPYHALRFAKLMTEEYEWGINFRRYISRKHETDEWVMIPRSERLQVSRWGHLRGVKDIAPPLHVNISPYISGASTFHAANSRWSRKSDQQFLAGLDLKYGITRNFTLDATVNPDFGQVEVDRAVMNLTVFETRYPEKRPFFLEGSHLFSFGTAVDNTSMPLFFSRRIGRRPTGPVPSGGSIKENPMVTTILGAAKFSGRSNEGLSVGALSALTDEEHAILESAGQSSSVRTEPRGTYNALRLKQDFDGDSWIGAIGTLVARENVLPALSGGVDWNIRLNGGGHTVDGYVVGTHTSTGFLSMQNGMAGRLLFSTLTAEHWFYTTSYDFSSRHFSPNDIGFFAQPHEHGGYMQLLYRENFAEGVFRRYSAAINPEYRWNWDGVYTHAALNTEFSAEFTNFWLGTLAYAYYPPAFDDAERGIFGTYRRPTQHSFRVSLGTDERESISLNVYGSYAFDTKRKRSVSTQVDLTLRPSTWIELTPLAYYERTRREEAGVLSNGYVVSVGGNSLFADRDVDELDIAFRGIVTFIKSLSLQFYTQALFARGRHSADRLLTGPESFEPQQIPWAAEKDFNRIVFNANILLRWEYMPGSTLYLVWTQGRLDDSGKYLTGFGQRFADTFSLPHEDVLLLKVSYWLPL